MDSNNGLRDETGALIGGLVVEDYLRGIDDFKAGNPPPDLTTPSYDLGRQRAAEKVEAANFVQGWIAKQEAETDRRMRDLLTPEQYAEYRAKIEEIRGLPR
jgi:hypothetical protein